MDEHTLTFRSQMVSAIFAYFGRNRRPALAILSAPLLVLLVIVVGATAAAGQSLVDPETSMPDIAVKVDASGSPSDRWVSDTVRALTRIDGIARATVDFPDEDSAMFYLVVDERRAARVSSDGLETSIRNAILSNQRDEGELTNGDIFFGGRRLTDEALRGSYGEATLALLFAALLMAAYVGWRAGLYRALAVGVGTVLSVLMAGRVAVQTFGSFNGALTSTVVVASMAGLVASTAVGLRLLRWFDSAPDEDGAALIIGSLSSMAIEFALVIAGMIGVLGVSWLFGSDTSAAIAVVVGATVGAFLAAAITTPLLTTRVVRDSPSPGQLGLLPTEVDTRSASLVVLGGSLLLLTALSLFVFRNPSNRLIDPFLTQDDGSVAGVLGQGVGDPTQAIVATPSSGAVDDWAAEAAVLPDVAWVDTASSRFVGADPVAVDEVVNLVPVVDGIGSDRIAVVVPSVSLRSSEGLRLFDDLTKVGTLPGQQSDVDTGAYGQVVMASSALAQQADPSGRNAIVVAVLLLAALGAGAIYLVTADWGQAMTTFVLRSIGGAAVVGVYRLIAGDVPAVEVLAVLFLASLATGLYELEFVRNPDRTLGLERAESGILVALFLAIAALLAAVFGLFGDGPTLVRFGFGMGTALLVEAFIGLVVLRPALLGQEASYHVAVRPLRRTIHSGSPRTGRREPVVDDPKWTKTVVNLVAAEFQLQADPDTGSPEDIFMSETPIHQSVVKQHASLSAAGLRVTGKSPQVRRVDRLSESLTSSVAITVDHPERHLVDRSGAVHGVRKPERRSSVLYIVHSPDGHYRVAESVDLGSVALSQEELDLREQIVIGDDEMYARGRKGGGPNGSASLSPAEFAQQ